MTQLTHKENSSPPAGRWRAPPTNLNPRGEWAEDGLEKPPGSGEPDLRPVPGTSSATKRRPVTSHWELGAPPKCLKLLTNFQVSIRASKLVFGGWNEGPDVEQRAWSKARVGTPHHGDRRLQPKLSSIPLHAEGPSPPGSPLQILRAAPELEQRPDARPVWDKRQCWSFCLDARPGSYSGGRGNYSRQLRAANATQKGDCSANKRGTLPCSCLPLPTAPSLPHTDYSNSKLLRRQYRKSNFSPIFA